MIEISEKQDFINNIIKTAEENPEFREKLLRDPKMVIESRLNFKLPENFEVVVVEDNPNKLNIVLPGKTEELSDAELSAVSGGGVCWSACDSGCCP